MIQRLACIGLLLAGGTTSSADEPAAVDRDTSTLSRLVRPVVRLAAEVSVRATDDSDAASPHPVVLRAEPCSLSDRASEVVPVTIGPPAADGPEYRIGLRFGNDRSVDAERPWLDIRPRTLPSDGAAILSEGQLPGDVSGLEPAEPIPAAVQLYAVDLQADDIWRGASFGYQPLYFEDRLLERYGSIGGVLKHCPVVHCGAQFAFATATWPISVLHSPPHRLVRNGNPSRVEAIPVARRATERIAETVKKRR